MNLCVPCVSNIVINSPEKLKALHYVIKHTNLKDLIDNTLYEKKDMPNLLVLFGNDKYETATDRFNENDYNTLLKSIAEMDLILPPEDET